MKRERKWRKREGWRACILCAICLMAWTCASGVDSKWIYEDDQIHNGDVYWSVGVFNDAILDMDGGQIMSQLTGEDTSTINMTGGWAHAIVGMESSTLNLFSGASADAIEFSSGASLNMFGGSVGNAEFFNSSEGNLRGGTISDYLLAYGTQELVISIYGYDLNYDADAGVYGGGRVTGVWGNMLPFSIDLFADALVGGPVIDTWSHVQLYEIPEPATLAVLALGAGFLRKRR